MDLSESGRNPVEELAEEFIERRRRGETPTLEEYASKFPDLADEIRSLFPALMMMEKLGADPGGTDALDEPALGRAMSSSVGRARSSSHLQHLGDFRILREVGRGGMGIVYEAEQESLGRRVALKVLGGHRVLDRGQVRRFEGEARSAARLHHTNIVPVFGVGEQDGTHYYVMQFIQGQALDEVLAELKRLRAVGPAESTARAEITAGQAFEPDVQASNSEISSQAGNPNRHVAESLLSGEFHVAGQADDARPVGEWDGLPRPSLPEDGLGRPSHGVLTDNSERDPLGDSSVTLHGRSELSTTGQSDRQYARSVARIGIQVADALEYANAQGILHRDIKPSNLLLDLTGTAWVTDFGLAKASDGDDLTHTGDVVGTLRYMAPERFRGHCDARADIYSLGLTLYELLALRPAYDARDRQQLIQQITQQEPARLRKLNPTVPSDLATIVHKAIAREPDHRYSTAAALAEDLERFIDDKPIRARHIHLAERLLRWSRRNPLVAGLSAAFLLALVGGFIGTSIGLVKAQAARKEEARQRGIANEKEVRATTAEKLANQRLAEVIQQQQRTADEAAIARAVVDFLQRDLLGQADIGKQAFLGGTAQRNPNITVVELLDRAANEVGRKFVDQPLTEAAVRLTLGDTYQALGRFPEAQLHLERSVRIRTDKLGALHPETLISKNNLAMVYVTQGRYDQAEPLLREVLEAHIAQLGAEHLDTLINKNNLARLYYALESYDQAEPLFKEALDSGSTSMSAVDPILLDIKTNLASVYTRQKKFDQAEPLFEELIVAMTSQEGADHPSTLITKGNLGYLYYVQGKYARAEPLYREVLAAATAKFGADHLDTLISKNNLATLYIAQKKHELAEPLLSEAVELARGKPGMTQPNTQMFFRNLVDCYEDMGQPAQGERFLREQADFWKRQSGADSARYADLLAQLGWNLMLQGKGIGAEPVLRECVSIREKNDRDAWPTSDSVWMLGMALLLQDKYEDAEPFLLAGYEGMQQQQAKIPPRFKPRLAAALERITRLYEAWDKPEEADQWRAKLDATKTELASEPR